MSHEIFRFQTYVPIEEFAQELNSARQESTRTEITTFDHIKEDELFRVPGLNFLPSGEAERVWCVKKTVSLLGTTPREVAVNLEGDTPGSTFVLSPDHKVEKIVD